LEIPLHSISDVSIKNTSDPSLKEIFDGHTKFKVETNKKLLFGSHHYQYIFVLSRDSLRNLQFIDLQPRNEWRILIEFDDAQNFLRVLKQRMAERKIEIEAEAAQNEKEIREMMEQFRNGTLGNSTWRNKWD